MKDKRNHRRVSLMASALALLTFGLVFLGACGGQPTTVTPEPMSTAQTQEPTSTPAGGAGISEPVSSPTVVTPSQENTARPTSASEAIAKLETKSDLTQNDSGGNVTVTATWEGLSGNDELSFDIAMNTHSVNLDQYDLSKLAFLRNDNGDQITPKAWESPEGGDHHRGGKLIFSLSDSAGKPFLNSDSKYVELVIQDIAGVKERTFRWDLSG